MPVPFLAVQVLVAPLTIAGQQPADTGTLARIQDEGFRRSQVLATAHRLSDGNGPRLAGSPGTSRRPPGRSAA